MLIKGEEKRGFSGKSAGDRFTFCSVVEFGSRPAKTARLLDRGLDFSNGDAGDEPMSEGNSGVTHELRSGLKVITSSEHMEKRGNTNFPGQDKINLDVDDTVSTSDDDRLFVVQVRSPKSRQLLHEGGVNDGQKIKVDLEEVDSSAEVSNIIKLGTGLGSKNVDGSNYDHQTEKLLRIRSDGDAATKGVQSEGAEMPEVLEANSKRTQVGLRENDGSCKPGDALHLEGEEAPGERIIKHYVRRPHSRANSQGAADMTEKSEPGVNSSEVAKVYVRTRKQSSATQVAAALQDGSHLEGGDPLGESIIKHYVRRPHSGANSHGPDQSSSGLVMMTTSSATNVSACSPQAEHHPRPPRVETEGILSVFQRRSKSNQDLQKKEDSVVSLQKKIPLKRSAEPHYVRADHQPRWLPEGWTLQIRIREGKKTPARIRDKYYHDQKTGHRFRSRNEVLQFLDYERLSRDGTAHSQDEKHSLPLPISPGFQSPPTIPAQTKTTPALPHCAVSTEAFRADMTWGHVEGPNGPIQLPWGPCGQGGQVNFDGGKRVVKPREEEQLPTASPVPAAEPPGDHGDKENRGKLILRLKRKMPDSDGGKGKSKRPTYEVVHVERPPLPPPSPPPQPPPEPVQDITYEARQPYISSHWGMDRHGPHHQHLDVVQEPYTALGIPATARTSGLQTMAAFSANHTHVFLDPIDNTIPASWQFGPFSSTFSIATTGPTLDASTRFPCSENRSFFPCSENRSSTLLLPCSENRSSTLLPCSENRSSALLPCSENRSRDSVSDVEGADDGPHRARLLTKGENSRLLVGLGRRLCQAAGVELWSSRKIGV